MNGSPSSSTVPKVLQASHLDSSSREKHPKLAVPSASASSPIKTTLRQNWCRNSTCHHRPSTLARTVRAGMIALLHLGYRLHDVLSLRLCYGHVSLLHRLLAP